MKEVIIYFTLLFFIFAPYVINGVKFLGCDFEENYRCEIVHGIGLVVPPAAYITVWFESDQ